MPAIAFTPGADGERAIPNPWKGAVRLVVGVVGSTRVAVGETADSNDCSDATSLDTFGSRLWVLAPPPVAEAAALEALDPISVPGAPALAPPIIRAASAGLSTCGAAAMRSRNTCNGTAATMQPPQSLRISPTRAAGPPSQRASSEPTTDGSCSHSQYRLSWVVWMNGFAAVEVPDPRLGGDGPAPLDGRCRFRGLRDRGSETGPVEEIEPVTPEVPPEAPLPYHSWRVLAATVYVTELALLGDGTFCVITWSAVWSG